MDEHQLSRVSQFITALEKASKDTGIRVHAHGSPLVISDMRTGDDAPFALNVNFGAEPPSSSYRVEEQR